MSSLKEILGQRKFPHYYGDIVRIFFLLAAIVMLLSLPTLTEILPIPVYISIISIMALIFVAGLTNPVQKWVIILDVIMSAIGFLVFEYYAAKIFSQNIDFFLFLVNQILAAIFLFAFYFATKTMRGFLVKERKD